MPQFYHGLRPWVGTLQWLRLFLGLLALTGFGLALRQTRLLPAWVGQTAIGWGLLWLLALAADAGAPAELFITPPLIGAALIWR